MGGINIKRLTFHLTFKHYFCYMTEAIRKLDYSKILFFDIETASSVKDLKKHPEMMKVFRYKNRDKITEELLSEKDTIALYNKTAALSSSFGKIVAITVGLVHEGKVRLQSFKGEEKDIIQKMINVINSSNRILGGFNLVAFDLPYFRQRANILGIQYPESINDSALKPWTLAEKIIDVMVLHKGTAFVQYGLDELCMVYNVPSPKESGVKGSEVSKVFWDGEIDKIVNYCEHDVHATINLFRRMRGEEIIEDFEIVQP